MAFEGTEKRLEMTVNQQKGSLRSQDRSFWQNILAPAGVRILSNMSNKHCDAYVLSESSLFIWDNRLLLLTCGNTRLIDATMDLIDWVGVDHIDALRYQRKHEFFPHLQSSCFDDDLIKLNSRLAGMTCRIKGGGDHHYYLFHRHNEGVHWPSSCLQMYGIKGALADYLCKSVQHKAEILAQLELLSLLPDFQFDDYLFSPYGYSLNGIHEQYYVTIHITPQQPNSYVSVETNLPPSTSLSTLFERLLVIFNPDHWETIGVNRPLATVYSAQVLKLADNKVAIDSGNAISINHYQRAISQSPCSVNG